jgi:hypothetical protein
MRLSLRVFLWIRESTHRKKKKQKRALTIRPEHNSEKRRQFVEKPFLAT